MREKVKNNYCILLTVSFIVLNTKLIFNKRSNYTLKIINFTFLLFANRSKMFELNTQNLICNIFVYFLGNFIKTLYAKLFEQYKILTF